MFKKLCCMEIIEILELKHENKVGYLHISMEIVGVSRQKHFKNDKNFMLTNSTDFHIL